MDMWRSSENTWKYLLLHPWGAQGPLVLLLTVKTPSTLLAKACCNYGEYHSGFPRSKMQALSCWWWSDSLSAPPFTSFSCCNHQITKSKPKLLISQHRSKTEILIYPLSASRVAYCHLRNPDNTCVCVRHKLSEGWIGSCVLCPAFQFFPPTCVPNFLSHFLFPSHAVTCGQLLELRHCLAVGMPAWGVTELSTGFLIILLILLEHLNSSACHRPGMLGRNVHKLGMLPVESECSTCGRLSPE